MMDLSLDYHAHVLPGCDHGSDSLKTSLGQLRLAQKAGVATICATSHFYPQRESVGSFLRRRQKAYDVLQPHLNQFGVDVLFGAEVLICDGMEHMPGLEKLCLEGTTELLLEMPFYAWPQSVVETLYNLLYRDDIVVVMAHVDRYPPSQIEELGKAGATMQINAEAIARHPLRRRKYFEWIERGWVRYLGSDIHLLGEEYRYWEKASKLIKGAR